MAIYYCSISNVSRAKGSSSCATLAYITGEKIRDSRTGNAYSYSRRERVLEVGTILPTSAPLEYENAETLWNAVENYEIADNARTAKKIQIALPREFDLVRQKEVIEDYIRRNLSAEGYCATYAIHDGGNNNNPHAHILVSNRTIDHKGNWGIKRKMAYALDEQGERIPILTSDGKQKTDGNGRKQWKRINVEQNKLDTTDYLLRLRKEWANVVNGYLPVSQQIDHRSNKARGIEEVPTIHEGYSARAIEKRTGSSERGKINRDIRRANQKIRCDREEIRKLKKEIEELEQEEEKEQQARLQAVAKEKEVLKPKYPSWVKNPHIEHGIPMNLSEKMTIEQLVKLEETANAAYQKCFDESIDREKVTEIVTKHMDAKEPQYREAIKTIEKEIEKIDAEQAEEQRNIQEELAQQQQKLKQREAEEAKTRSFRDAILAEKKRMDESLLGWKKVVFSLKVTPEEAEQRLKKATERKNGIQRNISDLEQKKEKKVLQYRSSKENALERLSDAQKAYEQRRELLISSNAEKKVAGLKELNILSQRVSTVLAERRKQEKQQQQERRKQQESADFSHAMKAFEKAGNVANAVKIAQEIQGRSKSDDPNYGLNIAKKAMEAYLQRSHQAKQKRQPKENERGYSR